jgi:hypothetical protein
MPPPRMQNGRQPPMWAQAHVRHVELEIPCLGAQCKVQMTNIIALIPHGQTSCL